MKTFLLAVALLACCNAFTQDQAKNDFRNLTTSEIEGNSQIETLIQAGLNQVIAIEQLENKLNSTEFVSESINNVAQKGFNNGNVYKIDINYINAVNETAHAKFVGVHNDKKNRNNVYSLTYTVNYPQNYTGFSGNFTKKDMNMTNSTNIYNRMSAYLIQNSNNTSTRNMTNGTNTVYDSLKTYFIENFNATNGTNTTDSNTVLYYNLRGYIMRNFNDTYNGTEGVYDSLKTYIIENFNATNSTNSTNTHNITFGYCLIENNRTNKTGAYNNTNGLYSTFNATNATNSTYTNTKEASNSTNFAVEDRDIKSLFKNFTNAGFSTLDLEQILQNFIDQYELNDLFDEELRNEALFGLALNANKLIDSLFELDC